MSFDKALTESCQCQENAGLISAENVKQLPPCPL